VTGAPFAPWALRGESIVGFARRRPPFPVPNGITPTLGPVMVTASRFSESPVGAFNQLAVAVPARAGLRFGWCVTMLVVDHQDARTGCRLNWGFPAELGRLRWRSEGDDRELVWDDHEVVVRARPRGPKVPLAVPHRELQQRGDGPVFVPDRMLGRFQAAVVRVHAYPGDMMAPLAGRHLGTVVAGANRVLREARTPFGLTSPLGAPAGVTEPLLSDLPRAS